MDIVVQLRSGEGAGMEGHWMDFLIDEDGEDAAQSVVRGVSFDDDLRTRIPLNQSGGGGERRLQEIERFLTFGRPVPRSIFPREAGEGCNDVGVEGDKSAVEVGKAQERLNVLDFARSWPVKNDLDLIFGHAETVRR